MKHESWKRLLPWSRDGARRARNVRLKGRLTVLREKRLEDVEADHRWRVDPDLAALDATSPMRLTLQEYTRYFRDELQYPSPVSVRLAIDALDGRHIGNVMYYDIDDQKRQAELGVMVGDRSYWDQGYGADAVMTLVAHIFEDTPINRVYLHTLASNGRARAAFRKCGFNDVDNVHRDGHDFILMEVRRGQWREEHALAPDAASADTTQADEAAAAERTFRESEPPG